ncbi:MAG: NAD(P)-dependent oxidoreductase [Candidatus Omnitrophica bacterium]|nr:NAD(P)-dependent oxidoreductase [Candidatus Omnitrophota bacterium]
MPNPDDKTIGLIGLGLVGSALAKRFTAAGFTVVGFDVNPDRRREMAAAGIAIAESCAHIPPQANRMVLSLPDSNCVMDVLFGPRGMGAGSLAGKWIVDTTTGDPMATVDIAQKVQSAGGAYIDACIIGSSRLVLEGGAVVSAGGREEDMRRCGDLFSAFTDKLFHMGSPGKGSQAKLAANLVLGLHRFVLSEGLLFAEALNLDLNKVLDLLKSGVSYSRIMDAKGEKMIARNFQPEARMAQHLKDVNLILQMGERFNAPLPLTRLHQKLLQQGVSEGKGDLDNCAIIEVLRLFSCANNPDPPAPKCSQK